MRIAEDPTNQKKVDTGEANHKRGRPESQFKVLSRRVGLADHE